MNKDTFITATKENYTLNEKQPSNGFMEGREEETILSISTTPEFTLEIPDNDSTKSLREEDEVDYRATIEKEEKKRNYTREIYDMHSEYEEGFTEFLTKPEKILAKDKDLFFFQFRKAIKNKEIGEIHGFMGAMVDAFVENVIIEKRREKEAKNQKSLTLPTSEEPSSLEEPIVDEIEGNLKSMKTIRRASRHTSNKSSRRSKRSTSDRIRKPIRSRLPSPRALNGNSELIIDLGHYTEEEQTFIEQLLSQPIFKDDTHWRGQCPLHQAVEMGDYHITKYLLGYFDVNVHDHITQTSALHIAIEKDHKTIIMLLCKLGADIDYSTALLESPLIQAIRLQNEVVVELLLFQFHANPNRFQKNIRQTPFVVCCEQGNRTIFELLRKARCNIDRITGYEGENALHYFCRTGNAQAIRMLLEKRRFRANVHTVNKHGFAPIHLACATADRDDIVAILLKHGASMNELMQSVSGDPGTPLSIAVSKGHHRCTKALLNNKADLNKIIKMTLSDYKKTVMTIACEKDDHLLVALLLKYNPDLAIPEGRPPLVVAAQRGNFTIAKLLLESHAATDVKYGDDNKTPLHLAAEAGHVKVVRLLLKYGADATAHTRSFNTALHIAALEGHRPVAQVMLQHGKVNMEARNRLRQTALHVACQRKHFHIVELLLRFKAKSDSMDTKPTQATTIIKQHRSPSSSTFTPGTNRFSTLTPSSPHAEQRFMHPSSLSNPRSKLILKSSSFLPMIKQNKPVWS